jgi:acyl-CoA reductase-like NAD-dependent aldehyde dehydrogenase
MSMQTLPSEFHLLIGGALVPGATSMPVINPATGAQLCECPRASSAQAGQAVDAAAAAFAGWRECSLAERRKSMSELADAMEAEEAALSRLLTLEQGKPLAEAAWEIQSSIGILRHFSGLDMPYKQIENSAERLVEQVHRPLGVVAAIVPWNFPILLMMFKLAPALLTGNTMVIKPAPTTPLTCLRIGELIARLLPPGVVNIVTDQNDLGPVLTRHPGVRKVSFTGSSATGRRVMASAAESLKRVTLELGGNDAAIVLGDVDPAEVAPRIFAAAFMNCGQVCLAIKRLYVHESIYEPMCEQLSIIARSLVVGDGMAPETQMGPLQNLMQYESIKSHLDQLRWEGKVIAGGNPIDRPGYFIEPTIVGRLSDTDRIVVEEQFGPILPVLRFSDPDEAVRRANASDMGLGGSIWSSDTEAAMRLASRMDAGMVWINKHLDIAPHIPFGGAKQSGMGVELGAEGLAEFTQLHVINRAG